MSNWDDVAGDILARISAYDSTAPAPSEAVLFQWAEMLQRAHVQHRFLAEGVIRVYAAGGDPPKNKLGAVIHEGREAQKASRQGAALAEITAGGTESVGAYGYPIQAAYEVDGAIDFPCPECDARPNEVCESGGGVKKIPHASRLAVAYRTNNAEGRAKHEARQAHERHHRATFKPSWR